MLLREDLRYIVFDVEATGLDKKHDEIIQIGIVEYNAQGSIVKEFCSYVRPTNTNALHDVVGMITGIKIDDLVTAPEWKDIAHEIAPFFGPTSVAIWHSVDFDISLLQRYGTYDMFTSIDTLPLAQSLYPYLPSYALEILAKSILSTLPKVTFHDALWDSIVTGSVFFQLVKKLESLLYWFPYLWEICKRTPSGVASCISYNNDIPHLLWELPVLSAPILPIKKFVETKNIPPGSWYIGNTDIDTVLWQVQIDHQVLWYSHFPKVLLTQKRLAKTGIMTPLHEQVALDSKTLHQFLTKQSYESREWHCAVKYLLHTQENHSSYHTINTHDSVFLQAMRLQVDRAIRKKLYTHQDLFEAVDQWHIPPEQHIIIWDKERLFDNWKRWKYKAYDLFDLATILDAFVYKYTLLWNKTWPLEQLRSAYYIFLWCWAWEAAQLCSDMQAEKASLPSITDSRYFHKTAKLWEACLVHLQACMPYYDTQDLVLIEKQSDHISGLFANPVVIHRKWGQWQERFLIQPEDTYTAWDDIITFFQTYTVSFFSTIDKKLPIISTFVQTLPKQKVIQKRKDITVTSTPKVCIIAPSKQAAQQLIVSLHKSDAYKDCFLAAEHITGGAWKIIQQTLWKPAYVLIWSYNFCIQCLAHSIEFDSIGALDIISSNTINPFTDIGYYASILDKANTLKTQ